MIYTTAELIGAASDGECRAALRWLSTVSDYAAGLIAEYLTRPRAARYELVWSDEPPHLRPATIALVTIGDGDRRGLHRADCPQVRRRDLTAPVASISDDDARAYLAAVGERRCQHCSPLPAAEATL
jgi:hypothetical protein